MSGVWQLLATLLLIYWLLFIFRLILDLVQVFARSWEPRGPLLVVAEIIYTLTDPPLRALRRIIPPLRIGGIAFDLAFLVILIGLQLLMSVVANLAV